MFFDLPRGRLGGSFGIPRRSRTLPRRPRTVPRSAQDAPGRSKTPKTTPRWPQTLPRHPEDAFWEEFGRYEGGFRGRSGCVSGFLLGSLWGRCGPPCWVGLEMFLYWFGRATLAERFRCTGTLRILWISNGGPRRTQENFHGNATQKLSHALPQVASYRI